MKSFKQIREAKSSSGYDLYHKDFSSAMQHAYAHAKKKGYVVSNDDIDNKVAMGPKKPSSGKTNKYILDTNKKQKVHIQVANLDNKRYELNMYIESVELEEAKFGDNDLVHIAKANVRGNNNPKTDKIIGYSKAPKNPNKFPDPKSGANAIMRIADAKKKGFKIESTELNEDFNPAAAIMLSYLAALTPFFYMAGKGMMKELGLLKSKAGKKGFKPSKEDKGLLQKFMDIVKRKKPDAVKNAMKKVKLAESEEFKPHKMYDPKTGKEYDAKTKDDHDKYAKLGYTHDKPELNEAALKNVRGKDGKTYALELDLSGRKVTVRTKNQFGDIKTLSIKQAAKLFEESILESAKRDAFRAMGKRGKDAADDDDVKATADDRKAADKNIIVQLRRVADLSKGGVIEFKNGKKVNLKQNLAKAVLMKYNSIKRNDLKLKFANMASQSPQDLQKALKLK
jgi:hypothetical protein